ncbi:unnamed protein product [Rotaria magnacalcarata]|uniref:Kringle domain-containing protein n=3 Tax=Rotaria magnacalcarata TaxID=392030 RepID=A0A819LZH5_9BILA|nr:unnamed protein product [Rotaria magnacalcarata]CAF1922465.1 unnamed protein product [Rotaria magnacalcarata]CAF2057660.1 unnamed protein product [Rotaria magnacalcarata]CAF2067523.1 unnamed protein product [Rotaria magnacalcarata]CAF3800837.1 unnamed protein product [Rotaria magnacalcarata]
MPSIHISFLISRIFFFSYQLLLLIPEVRIDILPLRAAMFLSLLAIIAIFGNLQGKPIIIRNVSDCSITEDGILHYRGKHSLTKFEHECLSWIDFQTMYGDIVNEANFFSDQSIQAAKNYCRNPNMNINGPWCYVQDEDVISMEGCDVCRSLSFRPTPSINVDSQEDVTVVSINNNLFHNVRDELRRYGIYIREKIMEIIDRMRKKFRQVRTSFSNYFKK